MYKNSDKYFEIIFTTLINIGLGFFSGVIHSNEWKIAIGIISFLEAIYLWVAYDKINESKCPLTNGPLGKWIGFTHGPIFLELMIVIRGVIFFLIAYFFIMPKTFIGARRLWVPYKQIIRNILASATFFIPAYFVGTFGRLFSLIKMAYSRLIFGGPLNGYFMLLVDGICFAIWYFLFNSIIVKWYMSAGLPILLRTGISIYGIYLFGREALTLWAHTYLSLKSKKEKSQKKI